MGARAPSQHPVPAIPEHQLLRVSGEERGVLGPTDGKVWEGQALHTTFIAREPETDEELKALEEAVYFGCEIVINGEDLWVTERTLPGFRAAAAPKSVIFGRNEPAVQHFHRLFHEAAEGSPI